MFVCFVCFNLEPLKLTYSVFELWWMLISQLLVFALSSLKRERNNCFLMLSRR